MGARSQGSDAGPARRRRYVRASILDDLRLADGRLAWPVAQSSGISEATFRSRLKAGRSPDEALAAPLTPAAVGRVGGAAAARRRTRAPWNTRPEGSKWDGLRLAGGRLAVDVAAASGVSVALLRLRLSRGWSPERAATEAPWSAVDRGRAGAAASRAGRRAQDRPREPRSGAPAGRPAPSR